MQQQQQYLRFYSYGSLKTICSFQSSLYTSPSRSATPWRGQNPVEMRGPFQQCPK